MTNKFILSCLFFRIFKIKGHFRNPRLHMNCNLSFRSGLCSPALYASCDIVNNRFNAKIVIFFSVFHPFIHCHEWDSQIWPSKLAHNYFLQDNDILCQARKSAKWAKGSKGLFQEEKGPLTVITVISFSVRRLLAGSQKLSLYINPLDCSKDSFCNSLEF